METIPLLAFLAVVLFVFALFSYVMEDRYSMLGAAMASVALAVADVMVALGC